MSDNSSNGIIQIASSSKNYFYTTVNTEAMNDANLSFKAKGILYYLLTRPSSWKVYIQDIINKSTDGQSSVDQGLKELKDNNYLAQIRYRKDGRIAWMYLIFAKPFKDIDEILSLENLLIENLSIENQGIYINNINKRIQKEKEVISQGVDREKQPVELPKITRTTSLPKHTLQNSRACAKYLARKILSVNPVFSLLQTSQHNVTVSNWTKEFESITDRYDFETIKSCIDWCFTDSFWARVRGAKMFVKNFESAILPNYETSLNRSNGKKPANFIEADEEMLEAMRRKCEAN